MASQEFQLVQLVQLGLEQPVQLHRPRWLQQRPEPVVDLGSCRVACRGLATREVAGNPAQPGQGRQLNGDAESVLLAVETGWPGQKPAGQDKSSADGVK
ncbi:hypothetical protein [Mycobacterium sp.]